MMHWQYTPYMVPLGIAAAVSVLTIGAVWQVGIDEA